MQDIYCTQSYIDNNHLFALDYLIKYISISGTTTSIKFYRYIAVNTVSARVSCFSFQNNFKIELTGVPKWTSTWHLFTHKIFVLALTSFVSDPMGFKATVSPFNSLIYRWLSQFDLDFTLPCILYFTQRRSLIIFTTQNISYKNTEILYWNETL